MKKSIIAFAAWAIATGCVDGPGGGAGDEQSQAPIMTAGSIITTNPCVERTTGPGGCFNQFIKWSAGGSFVVGGRPSPFPVTVKQGTPKTNPLNRTFDFYKVGTNEWQIRQRGTQQPSCMRPGDDFANDNRIYIVLCSDCSIRGVDYCRWNFTNGQNPSSSWTNLRNTRWYGGNSCLGSSNAAFFMYDDQNPRMGFCGNNVADNVYLDYAP